MRNADYLTPDQLQALGFAALGESVLVHQTCVLVGCANIHLGDQVRIDPFCVITASQSVEIGAFVHIAAHVSIVGAHGVTIADHASVSHGSRLFSVSDDFAAGGLFGPQVPDEFRAVRTGRVYLEQHTCLGANSVMLPGARLHEGATVGALSVVSGALDAWGVYVGAPARKIRERDRDAVFAKAAMFRADRGGTEA